MDFSAQFDDLQKRVAEAKAAAQTAATESRDQLKQRIDQAQDDLDQAIEETKQQGSQVADEARSKWAQMKADAAVPEGRRQGQDRPTDPGAGRQDRRHRRRLGRSERR